MNELLLKLKANARKGSKPRCHILTHGSHEEVAESLTDLIAPLGVVSATNKWLPQGFENMTEAQLHKTPHLFDDKTHCDKLKSWWLADTRRNGTTPNWDIASSCLIDGRRGLLLIEAKAHHTELNSKDSCKATNEKNYEQIRQAIQSANDALNDIQNGWHLTCEKHYQLCNRFAWSYKLATLGIPVILVYLGFLNDPDMPHPFPDAKSWEDAVIEYSKGIVPETVWGKKLMIGDVPIYPLIRSLDQPRVTIETARKIAGIE